MGGVHNITSVEYREDIANVYKCYFPKDTVIVADAHQYLLDHYKQFDFIWSSPPCQTHSRARLWGFRNSDKVKTKYPDMKLYQEIIFLQKYFDGLWVVENVKPFYDPLIKPSIQLGRHLFWSNFKLDFDGSLLRVSSRFYPPHKNAGNWWEGNVTVKFLDTELLKKEFKCDTLDELKTEVEKFTKHYADAIKYRLS